MDALGLFAAVVAVTLFPGGLFACAAAGGAALAAGFGGRRRPVDNGWTPAAFAAAALLLFAAALVPLPQSPALELPAPGDAPTNVLAVVLLAGGGVALGTVPRWPRSRIAAALAACVPLLVLAAQAATLAFPVVVGLPGPRLTAGRALAAAAILLAVPAMVATVLLAPPGWSGLPAAAAAALTLVGVALYGGVVRVALRALHGKTLHLSGVACAAAIAAIVLTVLASR